MAYPTVSAPYGFRPINRIGGNPYAGSTRLVPVDSGAMYNGDLVELLASVHQLVWPDCASTVCAFVGRDQRRRLYCG